MTRVTPKHDPEDKWPVTIRVQFVRYGRRRHSLVVYDGRTEVSPYTTMPVKKETKIPTKYIDSTKRTANWVDELAPRQPLKLVIPKWLAEELGISYVANNL